MIDVTQIVSDVADAESELSMADIVTSLTDAVPNVEVRYHRTGAPIGFTVEDEHEAQRVADWAYRMVVAS